MSETHGYPTLPADCASKTPNLGPDKHTSAAYPALPPEERHSPPPAACTAPPPPHISQQQVQHPLPVAHGHPSYLPGPAYSSQAPPTGAPPHLSQSGMDLMQRFKAFELANSESEPQSHSQGAPYAPRTRPSDGHQPPSQGVVGQPMKATEPSGPPRTATPAAMPTPRGPSHHGHFPASTSPQAEPIAALPSAGGYPQLSPRDPPGDAVGPAQTATPQPPNASRNANTNVQEQHSHEEDETTTDEEEEEESPASERGIDGVGGRVPPSSGTEERKMTPEEEQAAEKARIRKALQDMQATEHAIYLALTGQSARQKANKKRLLAEREKRKEAREARHQERLEQKEERVFQRQIRSAERALRRMGLPKAEREKVIEAMLNGDIDPGDLQEQQWSTAVPGSSYATKGNLETHFPYVMHKKVAFMSYGCFEALILEYRDRPGEPVIEKASPHESEQQNQNANGRRDQHDTEPN